MAELEAILEHHEPGQSNGPINWQTVLNLITQKPQEVTSCTLRDILLFGTTHTRPFGPNFDSIDYTNPIPLSLIYAVLNVSHTQVYDVNVVINFAFRNPAISIEVFKVILAHFSSDFKLLTGLIRSTWNVTKTQILLHTFPKAHASIIKYAIFDDMGTTESIIKTAMTDATFFGGTKTLRDVLLSKADENDLYPILSLVLRLKQDTVRMMIHRKILVKRDVSEFALLHAAITSGISEISDEEDSVVGFKWISLNTIKMLIELNPQALGNKGYQGYLPLHYALVRSHRPISRGMVQLLIEEGIKYNVGGDNALGGLLIQGPPTKLNNLPLLYLFQGVLVSAETFCSILRFLFKPECPILSKNDVIKYKLLYHLIENRNSFGSELLIVGSHIPEVLQAKTHEGNLPIHFAVKKRCLDLMGIRYLLSGDHDGRSIMIKNDNGHTALDLFFCNVNIEKRENFWECLELFWEISSSLPILQCAGDAGMKEKHMKEIMVRFDCIRNLDLDGRPLLHHAVANQSRKRYQSMKFIINVNPTAASIPDQEGRLPLFLALETTTWFNWVRRIKDIAEANYVNETDCRSGLYPFMSAAARQGKCQDLDSIYHLLRLSPHHLDYNPCLSSQDKDFLTRQMIPSPMTGKKRIRSQLD